ncbi:hypothetical protein Gpo141_00003024 [Globisporangium polare]
MASTSVSDFVALFYRQFSDGVVAPALQLPPSTVLPQGISDRLEQHALTFEALPGLLQRAVLWDAGLLLSGGSDDDDARDQLVQIWTRCDSSMADIAIHRQELTRGSSSSSSSSCEVTTCSSREGRWTDFIGSCDDPRSIQPLIRCAVASGANLAQALSNASLWSHESSIDLESRVPSFSVYRQARRTQHGVESRNAEGAEGVDGGAGDVTALYTIYTARGPSSDSCPQSLIIPCLALESATQGDGNQRWCPPQSHLQLETWLKEYAATSATTTSSSGFSWTPSKVIDITLAESRITAGTADYPVTSTVDALTSQDDPIAMSVDLVRHYFRLHARGGSLSLKLDGDVPAEILARLEPYQLTFHDLSGLLQYALIWDSGYALTVDIHGKTRLVEIKVKCGLRMADIALNVAYYTSVGCSYDDCSTTNATSNVTLYSYRAPKSCKIEQLERVSLCAVAPIATSDASTAILTSKDDSSLWAIGDLSSTSRDTVPRMRVTRRLVNASTIYTIDTSEGDVAIGQCPLRPAITVPCISYDKVARQSEWCRPVQGDLVTAWIADEERQYMALINLIVLAGAVLLAVAMDLFIDRKPRSIRMAAIGPAAPSFDSADMDVTEQSVQQSVVSGWSSTRSSTGR